MQILGMWGLLASSVAVQIDIYLQGQLRVASFPLARLEVTLTMSYRSLVGGVCEACQFWRRALFLDCVL